MYCVMAGRSPILAVLPAASSFRLGLDESAVASVKFILIKVADRRTRPDTAWRITAHVLWQPRLTGQIVQVKCRLGLQASAPISLSWH